MKFYIIDNGSRHVDEIISRVMAKNHDYEVEKHRPGIILNPRDADFIILSGGMQNEVVDVNFDGQPWFANEFALIRTSDKPILGICLGLQMIVVALGGTLTPLPKMVKENKTVNLTPKLAEYFGEQKITVYEAHQWIADNIKPTGLELMLSSDDGPELLVSSTRPIVATQFHPEVNIQGFNSEKLFWDLINMVKVTMPQV